MDTSRIRHFPRGSEWRRWDLHVHTPESILNNQFGSDWDAYVRALFNKAISNGIAAIGITDYFSIEGYRKLKTEYLENQQRLKALFREEIAKDETYLAKIHDILILPNIEFRIDRYVDTKKSLLEKEKKLTLQVLFSDEVSLKDIEDNFLRRLLIILRGHAQGSDETLPLMRESLERLGGQLRGEHPPFEKYSNYHLGCMQAAVDDSKISEILSDTPTVFKNKYLIILAEEYTNEMFWDGAGHHPRKLLYQKCDMIFSSNKGTVAWAKAQGHEFGGAKACIWGSDAHCFRELFESKGQNYCWIKADLTFDGLRQLVNEPGERCYIGECPPAVTVLRERQKPYIQGLTFIKNEGSQLSERWFDGLTLSFNSGMVTIIGNKGGGKSALADTLALLGTPNVSQTHFSFLKPERFRRRDTSLKLNRAEEFKAVVTWSSGEVVERHLSDDVRVGEYERVRYLPQGYLETLCNEDEDTRSEFSIELDRVIFSHVALPDRLGKTSLADLIDYRADEIKRTISSTKRHIRDLNHRISVIQQKTTDAAYAQLEEKLKAKARELSIIEEQRPPEMPGPQTNGTLSSENTQDMRKLEELSEQIIKLTEQEASSEKEISVLLIQIQEASRLCDRLNKFQGFCVDLRSDIEKVSAALQIDSSGILEIHVRKDPLEHFLKEKGDIVASIKEMLNSQNQQGFSKKKASLELEKSKIQSKLNAPNQQYQRYLSELAAWERRRKEIIGGDNVPETLEYYKAQLNDIEVTLPGELDRLIEERQVAVLKTYEQISKHADVYRQYYTPVLEFIAKQDKIGAESNLTFNVVIDGSRFPEQFFSIISQSVTGSFCGTLDGRKRLRDIMNRNSFDTGESALKFIEEVLGSLKEDIRDDSTSRKSVQHSIEKQIKKSFKLEDLYDFLYCMDYLEPRYALEFGGKGLQELSPGERGLLLLVFYLLIDKENCPLIIDQPEENLDNQSVKNVLVPCIKSAKKRRQLIIVTHNPNIAVVCDSEQIIFTKIDKLDNYQVCYDSGSIEAGLINLHIVNVLEGTRPAFENRSLKYKVSGTIQ